MAVSQASMENLKKGTPFTSETAQKYARAGQKKSVEARKRHKLERQILKILTGKAEITKEFLRTIYQYGLTDDDLLYCSYVFAKICMASVDYELYKDDEADY